jgi:hypothetical protein
VVFTKTRKSQRRLLIHAPVKKRKADDFVSSSAVELGHSERSFDILLVIKQKCLIVCCYLLLTS